MLSHKSFILILLLLPQLLRSQVDSTRQVSFKPYIVPTVMMAGGLITQGQLSRDIQQKIVRNYPNFTNHTDDYLQYGITVIPLAMSVVGIKGKHKLKDQLILTVLSHGLAQSITQSLKYIVAYPRPDLSENESFPSGHTTAAFTGATILAKEYGNRSVFYSVVGYGLATTVGTLRMLNNRHWLSDVLFGAGVGIASTQTVYLIYPWIQRKVFKNKQWAVVPTYTHGVAGLYAMATF